MEQSRANTSNRIMLGVENERTSRADLRRN
jgi:hypothetical protein